MQVILVMLIFCLTLFFYLHVMFHLKTSDDLEVFDINQPSKETLEEVCDLRQPMRMDFSNDNLENICQRSSITSKYQTFDVNIRNVKEPVCETGDVYAPLRWSNAVKVMDKDTKEKYLVEANKNFLNETGITKVYRDSDELIRPYLTICSEYDYITGSKGVQTPFRYNVHYRNYFFVVSGGVKMKLAPPKSIKYLHPFKDYHNFEFRSPLNPWNVQDEYLDDFDKIKCLDVTVDKGQILFIPAYWWYSMELQENTVVSAFKYDSAMSLVSTSHHYVVRFLQSHNIKRHKLHLLDKNIERNDTSEEISIPETEP